MSKWTLLSTGEVLLAKEVHKLKILKDSMSNDASKVYCPKFRIRGQSQMFPRKKRRTSKR